MKKALILGSALTLLTGASARAEIVIQPTLIESPSPIVAALTTEVIAPSPPHIERHHHYDWKYWQERHKDHDHDDR